MTNFSGSLSIFNGIKESRFVFNYNQKFISESMYILRVKLNNIKH
jgi:hypothetical protein